MLTIILTITSTQDTPYSRTCLRSTERSTSSRTNPHSSHPSAPSHLRQIETSYPYGLANHRQGRSYSIIRTLRRRVRPASSHIFSQLTPIANNYFIYPSILPYFSIQGTSWISTDPAESQDLYTLFSLYRTHSYLSTNRAQKSFTSLSGLKIIGADTTGGEHATPPVRLLFPKVPTFSSPGLPPEDGNPKTHPPARVKAYNGERCSFLVVFCLEL